MPMPMRASWKRKHGYVFVHPFDDVAVMAGAGTVALEMLEDAPDLDMLVIPIGGGGLISGVATAAKALKPGIKVIGVEAELYPSMKNVVEGGQWRDRRRYAGRGHCGQGARPADPRDHRRPGRPDRPGRRDATSSMPWRCW